MSSYRKKVFPLRLPKDFHGQLPQKKTQLYRQKQKVMSMDQCSTVNPEAGSSQIKQSKSISTWQIKRNNQLIQNQRRQYLTHTGKISNDTPNWFQNTSDFYRREQAQYLKKNINFKSQNNKCYDVFNRKRELLNDKSSMTNFNQKYQVKRDLIAYKNSSQNITDKIGRLTLNRRSGDTVQVNMNFDRNQITPKIGSVDYRDFSVKKSQIKVGKTQAINTYSPF